MLFIHKFPNTFHTFRSKLTLAFIITSMIPLLLSIFIALGIINDYLEKDSIQTLTSNANLETQQIEAKLEQIISMQNSLSSFFSTSLNASPSSKEISSSALSQFEVIRANVTSLEYIYGVERIRIYSDMLPFTSGDSFHFFPLDSLDSSLLKEVSGSLSGVNRLSFTYNSSAASSGNSNIVSFYKMVKNIKGDIIAVYFIDIDLEKTITQMLSTADNSSVLTISSGESVLCRHAGSPELARELLASGASRSQDTSQDSYQVERKSAFTAWTYSFTASKKELQKVNFALLSGYLFVFSLTILLCMASIIIFPNKLSKRIHHLSHVINGINEEDLATSSASEKLLSLVPRNPAYKDEIDGIISSFYDLFQRNMQLNHAVQKHLLEIEKSKFAILREQINPHFLYNSLDTIRICMLMGKKEISCNLIRSLAQFYRISLSKGKEIITLKEELEMISSYLHIEYVGYDEHIKWKFLCPAELENCGIPKFTLQPIVENSIVHCDFSHPDFLLSIEIKVFRQENSIYILVSDNGPGIPPEKLKELNTTLSSEHFTHTGSYGLQNCSQRIRLHYGNPYGIVLEHSSKGSCTCVRLPDMQVE